MRVIPEENIKILRFKRKVESEDGKPVKSITPKRELPAPEVVQAEALNHLVAAVDRSVQANDKSSLVIAQALTKIKMPDINFPEPEGWSKIEFRVTGRDKSGQLVTFTAERVS